MDRQELEDEMILRAGANGGEILNELDMIICKENDTSQRINKQQWLTFLRSVISKQAELQSEYEKRERDLDDDIPF
jgi:hypothetical protein